MNDSTVIFILIFGVILWLVFSEDRGSDRRAQNEERALREDLINGNTSLLEPFITADLPNGESFLTVHRSFLNSNSRPGDLTTPLFSKLDDSLFEHDREHDLSRPMDYNYAQYHATDLFTLDERDDLTRGD